MSTNRIEEETAAVFRYYAELNDLVPGGRVQREHIVHFTGNPSVGDVLEAHGIPRDRAELILVNGQSENLDYALRNEDRVSVYPVFESFDVTPLLRLRKTPMRECRFLCDVHLGRLVRWLRLLGFDTAYPEDTRDDAIVESALREHRIVLSRDRLLLERTEVTHGYRIRSEVPAEQLADVVQRFQLRGSMKPFTRCLECNGRLRSVAKDEISDQLEPKTRELFDEFFRCETCQRVYWRGSHYQRMQRRLQEMFGADIGIGQR